MSVKYDELHGHNYGARTVQQLYEDDELIQQYQFEDQILNLELHLIDALIEVKILVVGRLSFHHLTMMMTMTMIKVTEDSMCC
jgi:hypothetical protein